MEEITKICLEYAIITIAETVIQMCMYKLF